MQTTSMRSLLTRAAFALAVAICAFAPNAQAAVLNHGMFMGPSVAYLDVTETSSDPLPLFGAPVTIGDTLAFFEPGSTNPSLGFSAQSAGGIGDITDGFLNLTIMAKPGNGITDLTFSEGGDYTMSALGALAQVKAALIIQQLLITEVDNVPLTTPVLLTDIQQAEFNFGVDPDIGLWNLSSSFDLDAELNTAGHSGFSLGATKVVVKLNNTLTALSQLGSVASIVKKSFDIDPETRVPEPSTLALVAFGLVGMLAKRRTA